MKKLISHAFDSSSARKEWTEYSNLLNTKTVLSERTDILPFFKKRYDLSILMCHYFPKIINPNCFAHEFSIYGDFIADLVVGDSINHRYVLVEFENGCPDSIFKTKGKKITPDWSSRFEGAYSQLIDWFWKLEDMRSTSDFKNTFGSRNATFQGLIVIGKDINLDAQEKDRLDWRVQKTMIDSNPIAVVSFDELLSDSDGWLTRYYGA